MIGKDLNLRILTALFIVPTGSLDGWKLLGFNKIPQNKVTISQQKQIKIEVQKSASPLIYKLPEIKKVSQFSLQLSSEGDLSQLNSKDFKSHFPEDFLIRVGLVARGNQTLNWFQKKIAANWVLELFNLAPPEVGLDKIYFYNVTTQKDLVGQKRNHPKSDLMVEEIIAQYPESKSIEHKLAAPLDVVALWISVDGDDTKSTFATIIESLKLSTIE